MDQKKIEREIRFLKIYAGVATLICAVVLLSAFAVNRKQKFEEIDVERINVLDKDGKLRMVISNKDRQHPGMNNGKLLDRKREAAGLLFFNEKGDECGGLIFAENGGNGQVESLTFDKFRQDQTIGIQHVEHDDGTYHSGLTIWDRPNNTFEEADAKYAEINKITDETRRKNALKELRESGMFGNDRVFVGKFEDKSAVIKLSDAKGKPRIEISVAPDGNSKLNFLDENGKVIYSLPKKEKFKGK